MYLSEKREGDLRDLTLEPCTLQLGSIYMQMPAETQCHERQRGSGRGEEVEEAEDREEERVERGGRTDLL